NVRWEQTKHLAYISSPLVYRGVLFMVKDGGLVSSLDLATGKEVRQERVPGGGTYYASPVGGDGKGYLVSQSGDLAVLSAETEWRLLHRAKFGEDVYATPALADGRVYLRTAGHLYCFGEAAARTSAR